MTGADLHLDAYLARIGYAGALTPALETLAALTASHTAAIPFENLDILLGRPILLDLPALQAKLVDARRGGYCFEQNSLFSAVLERLGFQVTALAARVRIGATRVLGRTHMLLAVDLPSGRFLVDVGFGAETPLHPLPLEAGRERRIGDFGYRLHREGELWVLAADADGPWTDLYAFTLEPQLPIDFEIANHYTATHPASRFVQMLTAQRAWPDRRYVLRDRTLSVRDAAGQGTEMIRDPEHLLAVLAERFGLEFPAGTRFRQPQF